MPVQFEWDNTKNKRNFEKHGIWFEEAQEIFNYPVLTEIDDREDYGEIRERSIGMLGIEVVLMVAHTDRDGKTRLISARKANAKERQRYHDYIKEAFGRN